MTRAMAVCFLGLLSLSAPVLADECADWNTEHYFAVSSVSDVENCLQTGVDPNEQDDEGMTPLHFAAKVTNDPEIISVLVQASVAPDVLNNRGSTPLHFAAYFADDPSVIGVLVSAGADPNLPGVEGLTALHFAASRYEGSGMVSALAAVGADPNSRNEEGQTPLHLAAKLDEDPPRIAALVALGADPNAPDETGKTPIHVAAEYAESPQVVTALAAAGADMDAIAEGGWAPLHFAALSDEYPPLIASLEAVGANPNARDDNGRTPLHVAAEYAYGVRAIANLAAVGADPNAQDEDGWTPLHVAAELSDDPSFVSALAAAGADPNAPGQNGSTPLHLAARFAEEPQVIAALLSAGANPDAHETDGWTPLHNAAAFAENPDILAALAANTEDPDARDEGGWTPFHAAAQFAESPRHVAALLAVGADPFALKDGWSPLALAATHNVNHDVHAELLALHLPDHDEEPGLGPSPFQHTGLHEVRCWFAPPEIQARTECFFMVVREKPGDAASSLIAFPVVKFPAPNPDSSRNPVLHLGGGGPGGSKGFEDGVADIWSGYRDMVEGSGRDFYVIDPRGVGMAYPKLHCPEVFEFTHTIFPQAMTAKEEHGGFLDSYRLCKQRLDENGRDLSFYNSRSVAEDVEQLRRALDVKEWVLFGNSYGSRYALTIARHFPVTVEGMILNGAAFPHRTYAEQAAKMTYRAFERAFEWCDNANTCDGSRLHDKFRGLVASLDSDPMIIDDFSQEVATAYGVERLALNGGRLVDILFFALYDAGSFPKFSHVIDALEQGQTGTLEEAVSIWFNWLLDYTYSDPVANAHYCAEEHPFSNYDVGVKNAQASDAYIRDYLMYGLLYGMKANCDVWDVAAADPVEAERIITDIPTLFLQGALDPVTPEEDMLDELQHFERHAVLIFDDSSHWGSVHGRCAMKAAAHFIEHKGLSADVDYVRCEAE